MQRSTAAASDAAAAKSAVVAPKPAKYSTHQGSSRVQAHSHAARVVGRHWSSWLGLGLGLGFGLGLG